MKRLITLLFLLAWLAGCVHLPCGPKACPPGHRPGGLHPSEVAALRNHVKHGYKTLRGGDCKLALREFKLALEIDPLDAEARAGWDEANNCCNRVNGKAKGHKK